MGCCCAWLSFVLGPAALITGFLAIQNINKSNGTLGGKNLAIAGMALSPWYPVAGALALLRGGCIGFGVAVWETMLQEIVPARLLGRVVSLDFFGSFGLMPVGLALWGAIAGIAPPGPMIAAGAVVSAGMITVVLTRPWLRAVQ